MHPVGKRCIYWAIGLFIVGALAIVFVPDIVFAITNYLGVNGSAGVYPVEVILTIIRWAAFPTGAALIGAAVVIQVLAPRSDEESED
ncbi:hypothetical protein [Ancrocorticia populi]|uniref:Uncharacterized protein n=1 Tax=Ancrocorticia populi TaxID=2175228 RepID=A0A2V1KBV2_9ACTO|nr:hypothetical protein [Ancrocorticia populi]PWF26997.1 hypothetical protein DD236_00850 [Ancrocorticia populi]